MIGAAREERLWAGLALLGALAGLPVAAAQSDAERGHQLFAQGEQAYAEGRFTDAAGLMREAYALDPDPILLYNIARALEAAHDWQGAADTYRQYLATPGEITHRGRAEAFLRAAEQELAREQQLRDLSSRANAPPPVVPPASASIDPIPWVVAGAGLLTVGVGAVFGVLMLDRQSAAQAAMNHRDAYPAVQDGQIYAIVADLLFIVGGLTTAVGLAWAIVSLASGRPSVSAAIGPGSLRLEGQF